MSRAFSLLAAALAVVLAGTYTGSAQNASGEAPVFTAEGELAVPTGYREWVFVGTGLGMQYGPNKRPDTADLVFDNIYVNPSSYRAFISSGKWPEKTIFVMEGRVRETHALLANEGQTQGELRHLEASVKDTARFPGLTWGYFNFGRAQAPRPSAKALPTSAGCNTCHANNTAVDNTFVQYYPALFEAAKKFGTVKPTYDPARKF